MPNTGSLGSTCAHPCESYSGKYFFCYTAQDNSTWEYCGQWDVPVNKTEIIEFTQKDYVCADYCQEYEDYQWCHYVYYDNGGESSTGDWTSSWDYCDGHVSSTLSKSQIAWIVVGVLGAFILGLCCICSSSFRKWCIK